MIFNTLLSSGGHLLVLLGNIFADAAAGCKSKNIQTRKREREKESVYD